MGGMSESSFEYRQACAEQGANCADPHDLAQYLRRVTMDPWSATGPGGGRLPCPRRGRVVGRGSGGLPYPADRVERALFEDTMGSVDQLLVADPAVCDCAPTLHASAGGRCRGCQPGWHAA